MEIQVKYNQNEIELLDYFMLSSLRSIKIKDEDYKKYFEWSERGKHKELVESLSSVKDGFGALRQSKRWRGITVHELWEQGILDGSVPYYTLLGGTDERLIPRSIVDFLKREIFKGIDAETIEKCYQSIIEERSIKPLKELPINKNMPKCSTCRKNDIELLTRWQRFKNWLFYRLFPEDIIDLSQGKYTQGFSDGYEVGRRHGQVQNDAEYKAQKITRESMKEMDKMINTL